MSTKELIEMMRVSIETVTDDYESISPEAVTKITAMLENFTSEIDSILFYDPETVRR